MKFSRLGIIESSSCRDPLRKICTADFRFHQSDSVLAVYCSGLYDFSPFSSSSILLIRAPIASISHALLDTPSQHAELPADWLCRSFAAHQSFSANAQFFLSLLQCLPPIDCSLSRAGRSATGGRVRCDRYFWQIVQSCCAAALVV